MLPCTICSSDLNKSEKEFQKEEKKKEKKEDKIKKEEGVEKEEGGKSRLDDFKVGQKVTCFVTGVSEILKRNI